MRSLSKTMLYALLAVLALSAVAAASASAAPHWSQCQKVEGAGSYNSVACNETGKTNSYSLVKIPAGVKRSVEPDGGSFTLSGTIAGVEVTIACNHETGSGFIENPEGGGAGKGKIEAKLTGCIVTSPKGYGCKVAGETYELAANTELVENGSAYELALSPVSGTSFGKVSIESCTVTALNNTDTVTGSFKAVANSSLGPAPSYYGLSFTTTSSKGLKLGGNSATLNGSTLLEVEGSQPERSWYACEKHAGGKYSSSTCGTEGAPNEYEWTKLPESKKTNVVMSNNFSNFDLNYLLAGVQWEIQCEKQNDSGSIENRPNGNYFATGESTAFHLTLCSQVKPATHCTVKPIEFSAATEVLLSGGSTYVKFAGPPTGPLFQFTLEGCSPWSGSYSVKGSFKGNLQYPVGELDFSESTSELSMGGVPFWIVGKTKFELEGGGAMRTGSGLIGVKVS